jgi:sulfate adenylyltransferase subunit 2
METYNLNYLRELEAESVYVIREVAAQFERPALLFSGGKDSIVLAHLSRKAFYPAKIPYPLIHIDTGHNFEDTLTFRDELVAELGVRLIVGKVQDSIDSGRVKEETGYNASRNMLQTVTLLDSLEEHKIDAAMGGARRDEEKARAKEVSFRIAMNSGNGIPRIRDRNFGIFSTERRTPANTSECFLLATGRRWMFGNIFTWKK